MSFYLRHFAGFFIQIGSGMFLCLMPFRDDALRLRRRWVMAGCGLLALISSAIFPIVIGMESIRNTYQTQFANLYMLVALIAFVVLYFCILRVEMIKRVIALVLALFYAGTQYMLVNLILALNDRFDTSEIYAPFTLALFAGTDVLLLPFCSWFMGRVMREYLEEIEPQRIQRDFRAVILASFLYIGMLMFYASWPDIPLDFFGQWVIPPLLLGAAILGLLYRTSFQESVRRKRDEEERKTLEIQKIQYDTITRDVEYVRQLRHDMHHSLNHLSELLAEGNQEEMSAYLSELTVQISHRNMVVYCKNKIINGLLQYYVGMAADRNITCTVNAECGDININSVDLTVMMGNTMENAIRACEKFEVNRWITVEIGVLGNSMLIQISNPCQDVHPSGKYRIDESFLPASAFRSERQAGGYGLYSLEHAAKKYDGEASFRYDKRVGTFTTRIRLGLHPNNT